MRIPILISLHETLTQMTEGTLTDSELDVCIVCLTIERSWIMDWPPSGLIITLPRPRRRLIEPRTVECLRACISKAEKQGRALWRHVHIDNLLGGIAVQELNKILKKMGLNQIVGDSHILTKRCTARFCTELMRANAEENSHHIRCIVDSEPIVEESVTSDYE